jgi:hypothetical protein
MNRMASVSKWLGSMLKKNQDRITGVTRAHVQKEIAKRHLAKSVCEAEINLTAARIAPDKL